VLKVAEIIGSMLVFASPEFGLSRLSKMTAPAEAGLANAKSKTAAAAHAALPVRERMDSPVEQPTVAYYATRNPESQNLWDPLFC